MSPDHRRFWHRKDVEKQLGPLAEAPEKEAKDESTREVRKRYVTDADLIPTWSDDDGWLPLDWRIGFKQKPLSVHKIYIPPGQDEGFCYQKQDVLEYLRTGKKLTRFGVSKPLAVRKAIAAAAKKRKRSRGSRGSSRGSEETAHFPKRFASAADYEEVEHLTFQKLPLSKTDEKSFGLEAQQLMKNSKVENPIILQKLCGLFYQRPDVFGERPFFQQIRCEIRGPMKRLVCTDQHVFYSPKYSCWKVGILKEDRAGYLTCHDAAKMPWEVQHPWKMVKEKLCRR